MFPGVYGFQWSAGYLIFLGIFFSVLAVIAVTLAMVARRTYLAYRARRAGALRWQADFQDLPASDRACRHDIDGRLPGRLCFNGFDCRFCTRHPDVVKTPAPSLAETVLTAL